MDDGIAEKLRSVALDTHRRPTPGKIAVTPSKGLTNQRDHCLALCPGVADACLAIGDDAREAGTPSARAPTGRRREQRHGGVGPLQHRRQWRPLYAMNTVAAERVGSDH